MLRLFQRNDDDDGVEELPMEVDIPMEGERDRNTSDLSTIIRRRKERVAGLIRRRGEQEHGKKTSEMNICLF
ncbi:unnamed protein product [Brassica oleracea var. botrytis]